MDKVYVLYQDVGDRWLAGDRIIRRIARKWLRPPPTHLSGMRRVVQNFLTGLERKSIQYELNPLSYLVPRHTPVISFGMGRLGVHGLRPDTPLIAAIGFPYPTEFPELSQKYNLRQFLQHSNWTLDLVRSSGIYDEKVFALWHAGIDTEWWRPLRHKDPEQHKIVIYDKIHWDRAQWNANLIQPIKEYVNTMGLDVHVLRYGCYKPGEYRALLQTAGAAIFLSPHESQGFAYQECLACDVPVLAWDPGIWLDPIRFSYGRSKVAATSVPFFDERCGATFRDFNEFRQQFDRFINASFKHAFKPRDFVVENLTIERSTSRMLELLKEV